MMREKKEKKVDSVRTLSDQTFNMEQALNQILNQALVGLFVQSKVIYCVLCPCLTESAHACV